MINLNDSEERRLFLGDLIGPTQTWVSEVVVMSPHSC